MPPRPPRVSAKKAAAFSENLGQARAEKRRRELIDKITREVKNCDETKLLALDAIISGQSEAAPESFFPRGVVFVGGLPPKGVPYFVQLQCVHLASGKSKGELEQLPDHKKSIAALYLFGMGKSADTPIPERKMLHSDYFKWYLEQHRLQNEPLSTIDFDGDLSWTIDIGQFALAEGDADSGVYDHILCRASGQKVAWVINGKPVSISFDQIDTEWRIVDNWSLHTAKLINCKEGASFELRHRFPGLVAREDAVPQHGAQGSPKKQKCSRDPPTSPAPSPKVRRAGAELLEQWSPGQPAKVAATTDDGSRSAQALASASGPEGAVAGVATANPSVVGDALAYAAQGQQMQKPGLGANREDEVPPPGAVA